MEMAKDHQTQSFYAHQLLVVAYIKNPVLSSFESQPNQNLREKNKLAVS